MAKVSTKVDPINRDIALIQSQELSPESRAMLHAQYAREVLIDAQQINLRVLGRIPPHRTFVDGAEGASEEFVRPNGVIIYEFDLVVSLLVWIGKELERISPVGKAPKDKHPGRYRGSHTLFADGKEVSLGGRIPIADEYVFMSTVDYAIPLERGKKRSSQAPNGVYEITARNAKRTFGNVAYIEFNFRSLYDAGKYRKLGSGGRDSKSGRFKKNSNAVQPDRSYNSSRRPSILVRYGGRK